MKYIFFLLLFLMSFQCSTKRNILESFKNPKLKVDTTIKSQPLKLIKTVHIEETPYLILSDIYDVQFNTDTTQILITDPANRTANLYDYKTGKIINWIRAGINLSDSVAYSKWKGPPLSESHNFQKFRFLKLNELEKYKISKNDIKKFIKNRFFKARFIGNNIYLTTSIKVAASTKDTFKTLSNNMAMVICNNKLQEQRVIVFEIIPKSFPMKYDFLYNKENKTYFITNDNNIKIFYKNYDSLTIVGEYDSKGNFIRNVSYLPSKFAKYKMGTDLIRAHFLKVNKKEYIYLNFDLCIYDFHKKIFNFYNLPTANDSGFVFYHKLIKRIKSGNNKISINDILYIKTTLFPIRNLHTFAANRNILVQFLVINSFQNDDDYYILQEYSTDGKLLSQTNIYDDPDNRIKYITFDNKNNYLVIFKKSKQGWTMEKRQWL